MKHQNINPRHNFVSLLAWRVIPLFVVLQAFIRDAEYVDSLSASHEAFLSNDDLGVFTNLLCLCDVLTKVMRKAIRLTFFICKEVEHFHEE